MTSQPLNDKRPAIQFTIAETMILAAVVGAVVRWPAMIWIAIPLAVHWTLRRLSVHQRFRYWLPALGIYFVLLPFKFAPVLQADFWLAQHVFKSSHLYSLSMYRPVMLTVKYTPLYYPVWKWTRWLNPRVKWPDVEREEEMT
jgi:hypothetical protein